MKFGVRWNSIDSTEEWLLLGVEMLAISVVVLVIMVVAVGCAIGCAVQAVIDWNPRYLSDLFGEFED